GKAGKHVLVEKPIARTLAEAEEIQRTVEASDRVVQVGFVRRHSPNCQVLKSFIDAGELGEVYYAKASCLRRVGNPGGWFADKEISEIGTCASSSRSPAPSPRPRRSSGRWRPATAWCRWASCAATPPTARC